jgi:putative transposase
MSKDGTADLTLAGLTEARRREAMARLSVLRPHLEDDVSLAAAARHAGVPLRTAERWLARYRRDGFVGLARRPRRDAGGRRLPTELVTLIEGLGLMKPRASAAGIHRRIVAVAVAVAGKEGWPAPSYATVAAILARLDPAMVALAHDDASSFRDRFEMIHRHRAGAPNAIWQCDHTLLDILILDEAGKPARPWLTTVLDDHSRALAGYCAFLGAPSALQTSLALRQAIWRKAEPDWPVCGVPDILYVDHGADFTSAHLDQVAAALGFRIVYSAVARPQGRGKIERFFGTLSQELLPELAGRLVAGKPVTPAALSLAELDEAIGRFIRDRYHMRVHHEIGATPLASWRGEGFLPRLPDSLEELDLLLIMHAKPRTVRRDGIRFEGLRYVSPLLAAYVQEAVTIRYDPRDLSEIRVFHRGRFLCRAISEAHAGEVVTLKDIEAARRARRRALRDGVKERVARVADYLPKPAPAPTPRPAPPVKPSSRLRVYLEDRS